MNPPSQPASADASPVVRLTDRLFREEAGRLVSILTGIFGLHRLHLAEDVVQEALLRALQHWPFHGIPANPAGWLMQTARHLALDRIRRETSFAAKQSEIIAFLEQRLQEPAEPGRLRFEDEIQDDRLRLMFACCHPLLPQESQSALALKVLCGFSPAEIGSAFLTSEAAIAKRLTRARQRLREARVAFEIPAAAELPARLDGVLQILYLLFNEGYKASQGERLTRDDLCTEAIRLTRLLVGHPAGRTPAAHALLALMLLNAARLPARQDEAGRLLRLEEQDRSLWDHGLIQRGLLHLGESARGDQASEYHLQAGIAACHCLAPSAEATDWPQILRLYDHLQQLNDSPVIALNRAIALARVQGPAQGLAAIEAILDRQPLAAYHLFHATLGELEAERAHYQAAARHLRTALQHAEVAAERRHLHRRLDEIERRVTRAQAPPGRPATPPARAAIPALPVKPDPPAMP